MTKLLFRIQLARMDFLIRDAEERRLEVGLDDTATVD